MTAPYITRRQARARIVAAAKYPYRCCVICGTTHCLEVAHLDQDSTNDAPDNLAYLCGACHDRVDADLHPIEAVKLLRDHWQVTKGVPNYTRAKRAVVTRKANAAARQSDHQPQMFP